MTTTPPTNFTPVLKDLLAWFDAASAPLLIIGGVAVSLIAVPRTTLDLDAITLTELDAIGNLLAQGKTFGFIPRREQAVLFAQRNRMLLVQHQPTGTAVDISVAGLPFEEESFARRQLLNIGGLSVPLPSPEDLVIMKAVAHRPRDLQDIATILEIYPEMDWQRVRQWVQEFARVLEMPEIFDDLQQIRKKRPQRK